MGETRGLADGQMGSLMSQPRSRNLRFNTGLLCFSMRHAFDSQWDFFNGLVFPN